MAASEIVDVVDGKDRVLYQTSKQDAHDKGLLHRTVISEIRDSKGNWILVRQAKDRQDAGQYVSPVGGHVRAHRKFSGAELKEELGKNPRLFGEAFHFIVDTFYPQLKEKEVMVKRI